VKNWQIFLVILLLAFILFGNGIVGDFVYDDQWVVVLNPTINRASSIPSQFVLPYHYNQPETGLYRPLTVVSFAINALVSAKPWGFHAVNIILHALVAYFLFVLVLRLFKNRTAALWSAALFLVLPIHAEGVTSIIGRADELAALFSILTLLALVDGKAWLSALWFGLAIFSKESALGVLPVAVFVILFLKGHTWRKTIRPVLYFAIPIALYFVLRYIALDGHLLSTDASYIYNPLKYVSWWPRLLTVLSVTAQYVWKTFVPIHLSADYSFNQIPILYSIANFGVVAGAILLAGLATLSFWRKTRSSMIGFGAFLFLCTYFIASNLVLPVGTIMAERLMYVPSLGLCIIIGYLISKLLVTRGPALPASLGGRTAALVACILIFIVYGWRTIDRNRVWYDRLSLYSDMTKESPASVHGWANLGIYYIQNNEWQKGEQTLLRAQSIAPDHLPLLDSLGIVAEHAGNLDLAETYYRKALAVRPYYATAVSNLTRMYYQNNQFEQSAQLALDAFNHQHNEQLMTVYSMSLIRLKRYDEALQTIVANYGDQPDDVNLVFAVGVIYWKKGDNARAQPYLDAAKNPTISEEEYMKIVNGL